MNGIDITDMAIRNYITIDGQPIITNTVVTTWAIMAILVAFSIFVVRGLKAVPGALQLIVELILEGVHWLGDSTMGRDKRYFAPYMLALALYLALANLTGLVAVRQPTADLNTTFALSLMTFFMVQFFGFKAKKFGYVKGFFQPLPFLFPLNLISELAQPISLSFRLFGNMLGSVVIMLMIYMFLPMLFPLVGHLYFDVFAGLIQTFIFVMLTMTYITLAME